MHATAVRDGDSPLALDPLATFSTSEAADMAGVPYAQLDRWARNGIVVPSIPAHGTGSRRRYSVGDVRLARIAKRLASVGCADGAFRKAMRQVPDVLDFDPFARVVVVDPEGRVEFHGLDGRAWAGRESCWVVSAE